MRTLQFHILPKIHEQVISEEIISYLMDFTISQKWDTLWVQYVL